MLAGVASRKRDPGLGEERFIYNMLHARCISSLLPRITFFFSFNVFILFFGCIGSLLLCAGFSPVAANGGYPSVWCMGFSLRWLLLLQSTSSRRCGLQ